MAMGMPRLGHERASLGGLESASDQGEAAAFARRLAFDAGVDRSYVGGLERQEENPTVDLLDKLAKTLSVPLSEFFTEPVKGTNPPKPLRRGRRSSRAD